jgi:hypothetical protein
VFHPFLSSDSSDGFFAVTRVYGLPKAGGKDLTTIPGHTYPCRTPQAGATRVSLAAFGAVRATLGIVTRAAPAIAHERPPTSSSRRPEAPNPGAAGRRQTPAGGLSPGWCVPTHSAAGPADTLLQPNLD